MNSKKITTLIGSAIAISGLTTSCNNAAKQDNKSEKPNVLLVVVDDLGFSDLASYGSEIKTPTVDRLAQNGTRFTNFHTSSLSAPTRSMLLTGVDTHENGLGVMPFLHGTNQYMQPGYEGSLNQNVITLPEILQENGYHTYMSGKWHLGENEGHRPVDRGFERSFSFLGGGASHFNDAMPLSNLEAPVTVYVEDDKVINTLPDTFFSSDYYADKMIQYLDEQKDDKPFFAYLAFTAPHDPLQVPEAWLDKYKGVYDGGYDSIRIARLKRQKELGLFDSSLKDNFGLGKFKKWDELTAEEKKIEARRMEIYAAMIENMDYNLNRVLQKLKDDGKLDNTLIVFMSDNGANPKNMEDYGEVADGFTVDNSYENIGRKGSFESIEHAWAEVCNTPFSYFKMVQGEGGIRTPLIIAGMNVAKNKINKTDLLHVADLMPTILEYTDSKRPDAKPDNTPYAPLYGKSIKTNLDNPDIPVRTDDEYLCFEMIEGKSVIKGNWKALYVTPPYGNSVWELYDLHKDPREKHNLATQKPEILKDLVNKWNQYAEEKGYIKTNGKLAIKVLGPKEYYKFEKPLE